MNWKRMLAYITGSVDQQLLLRNEYPVAENRILRRQVQGQLRLTDSERISLAKIGKQLGRKILSEVGANAFVQKPARNDALQRLLEHVNRFWFEHHGFPPQIPEIH